MTIATPHRGALLAENTPIIEDRAVTDMYRSSLFLVKLEEAYKGDYEIIPYARLNDGVVGTINTAPPGRTPIWVSGPVVGGSHLTINEDKRILADIARRLRGEEPRGVEGEPLPPSSDSGGPSGLSPSSHCLASAFRVSRLARVEPAGIIA